MHAVQSSSAREHTHSADGWQVCMYGLEAGRLRAKSVRSTLFRRQHHIGTAARMVIGAQGGSSGNTA